MTRSSGILPSSSLPLTRNASASCGSCHSGTPGGPTVQVQLGLRVLSGSQTTAITVSATGGAAGTRGGLAADVTAGQLIAGANTRTSTAGNALTHSDDRSRTWTFNYQAPAQTGPVEFYTVVNAVNGDGRTNGDTWAFHGSNPTNPVSTPVRMYVNAPGVVPIGSGCADGYGNVAVYGAPQPPTLGNPNFSLEAIGLPPSARVMLIIGLQKNMPSFDMGVMGAPGCFLHTDLAASVYGISTPGDASRAEGRFVIPVAIPSNPVLKGFFFRTQVGAVDASPGARALPVVFTNGLGVTLQ
ncbi:MAG: hypothetical protein KDC87_09965 [Planctomycetes bacterium]|nr:hypothetical protein [Planctomycetota bacterium]